MRTRYPQARFQAVRAAWGPMVLLREPDVQVREADTRRQPAGVVVTKRADRVFNAMAGDRCPDCGHSVRFHSGIVHPAKGRMPPWSCSDTLECDCVRVTTVDEDGYLVWA